MLVPSDVIRQIPDVERSGSTFTDGVGTISPSLLAKVISAYQQGRRRGGQQGTSTSQVQFRLGGLKIRLFLLSSLHAHRSPLLTKPSHLF
jgi:hypothetical protein